MGVLILKSMFRRRLHPPILTAAAFGCFIIWHAATVPRRLFLQRSLLSWMGWIMPLSARSLKPLSMLIWITLTPVSRPQRRIVCIMVVPLMRDWPRSKKWSIRNKCFGTLKPLGTKKTISHSNRANGVINELCGWTRGGRFRIGIQANTHTLAVSPLKK